MYIQHWWITGDKRVHSPQEKSYEGPEDWPWMPPPTQETHPKGSRVKKRASKGERRRQALLVRARTFHLLFRIKRFAFIETMAGPPYVGCDSGRSVYFLDKPCMCNSLLHAGPSTVGVKLTALRECSGYYCVNVARPWDPHILSNTFGCCCEGIFFNSYISRLWVKQIVLHSVNGLHPII